jgi:hypothetical protein
MPDNDLIAGERIDVTPPEIDLSALFPNDAAINDKYVRGEIRIVTEQGRYPISAIAAMVDDPSYVLSPEYQRRHRWLPDRQSRLIESLIMNVPIPPIFLYEFEFSKYEVMDGLQRLMAIHDFYKDKYPLSDLAEWPELNGRVYSNLPEKIREGIDRRYLSSIILLKETAKTEPEALQLKKMVFERLNSGGERLTPQETRNAIFNGPLNRLCIKLSKIAPLCRLWGLPEANQEEIDGGIVSNERVENEAFRRMEDVELVLRFFAYRQKHRLHKSGTSLSSYFDFYLRQGNTFNADTLSQMEALFVGTIHLIEDTFGERAFWLYRRRGTNWSWLERPTTTVYDPLMLVMSERLQDAAEIRKRAAQFQENIATFYQTNYGTFEGRNVNRSILVERDQKFRDLVASILA